MVAVQRMSSSSLLTLTLNCLTVGRESTLALTIMGDALGPDLQPNYSVMDMGNVFMGSNNCYEVRLMNPQDCNDRCVQCSNLQSIRAPALTDVSISQMFAPLHI